MKIPPNISEKGDGKWELRFRYTDHRTGKKKRYKRVIQGTLEDAKEELKMARAKVLLHGADPKKAQEQARVKDFLDTFLQVRVSRGRGRHTRRRRHATLERDANHLDMHIFPEIGDWYIAKITLQDLDDLVTRWTTKTIHSLNQKTGERVDTGRYYAASTINGWIKVLKLYFAFASSRLQIPDASKSLEPLPEERRVVEPLSMEEARAFLTVAKERCPQLWCLFFLAMITSRRFSELTALHVDDIDYGKPLSFHYSQNEGRLVDGDKTHKRHLFPMLPEIQDAIQWHLRELIRQKHAGLHSGILFPARVKDAEVAAYRGYLSKTGVNRWVKECARVAGIKRRVTFHTLRHTCNSWLVSANVSGELIRAITGHESADMTAHYAQHISLDARRDVVTPLVRGLALPGYSMGTPMQNTGE